MTQIHTFSSMCELTIPYRHSDAKIFPDDTNWFLLLEKYVFADNYTNRIYQITGSNDFDKVLLPLHKIVNRLGLVKLLAIQNYYSVDYRPICTSIESRSLISTLLTHVLETEKPHTVSLQPLDPGAEEVSLLEKSFKKNGWLIVQEVCQINWVHYFSGGYDEYIHTLPKRLRNTIKRKSIHLFTLPNVEIKITDGKVGIEDIILGYEQVYRNSWKKPEPHDRFIPELIKAMGARGELRLGLLLVDRKPIAVHFWIVKQTVAYIYKLAHDNRFDKYSPGTVLMAEMVKYCLDNDGINKLDFMSGDDAYKRDWMSQRNVKKQLVAYNMRTVRGWILAHYECYLKPTIKRILKSLEAKNKQNVQQ